MDIRSFLRDESGQTTTEYVLILAVVLTIIMQFKKGIMKTMLRLMNGVNAGVDETLNDMRNGGSSSYND